MVMKQWFGLFLSDVLTLDRREIWEGTGQCFKALTLFPTSFLGVIVEFKLFCGFSYGGSRTKSRGSKSKIYSSLACYLLQREEQTSRSSGVQHNKQC